jgi:hypothetical protein
MNTDLAENVYVLLMFLAYVMRRAGTFTMAEKVEMIEFLGYVANYHTLPLLPRAHDMQLDQESHDHIHGPYIQTSVSVLVNDP